jgi:cytochrome c oxidase subunit 3
MEVADINKPLTHRNKIHPKLFALWISFASIIMMFGALTSAYIVKSAAGNWLEYQLPQQFYFSTGVILLCSLTLHISFSSFVKEKEWMYKSMLLISFILGISFVVIQYSGWQSLYASGVDLKASISGSFMYLITGLHAVHILAGVATMVVAIVHAFSLPFVVTEKRKLRFRLVCHYWHFVDFLWIYLFGFLMFYK